MCVDQLVTECLAIASTLRHASQRPHINRKFCQASWKLADCPNISPFDRPSLLLLDAPWIFDVGRFLIPVSRFENGYFIFQRSSVQSHVHLVQQGGSAYRRSQARCRSVGQCKDGPFTTLAYAAGTYSMLIAELDVTVTQMDLEVCNFRATVKSPHIRLFVSCHLMASCRRVYRVDRAQSLSLKYPRHGMSHRWLRRFLHNES